VNSRIRGVSEMLSSLLVFDHRRTFSATTFDAPAPAAAMPNVSVGTLLLCATSGGR
jgi:hypothetical protein